MFIKSIVVTPESGTVAVIIANEIGTGEECLILSIGEWRRMCKSLGFTPKELDELTEELYDTLHLSAEKTAALREAARILTNGDKSAREIRFKLTKKGFSPEAADHAVVFLEKKGYLNEDQACIRIAEAAVRAKHYGKRRIVDYLRSHGYSAEAAKNAAEAIPDEDYSEALRYQMEKILRRRDKDSREDRQKIIAAMMRQGFSASEIIAAMKDE